MTGKFLVTFTDGTEAELVGAGKTVTLAMFDLLTALATGALTKLTEFYDNVASIEYTGEESEEEDETCE